MTSRDAGIRALTGLATSFQLGLRKLRTEGVRSTLRVFLTNYRPYPLRDIVVPFALYHYPNNVLPRTELRSRATNDDRLWHLESEDFDFPEVSGELPSTVVSTDTRRDSIVPPFENGQPLTNDPPFVCEVPNGRIVGDDPVGVTADGKVIVDTVTNTTRDNRRLADAAYTILKRHGLGFVLNELSEGDPRSHLTSEGPRYGTASLLTNGWTNYFHWTVEHIPKIRAIERYRNATGRDPHLIIPSDPPNWMLELLELVGVNCANCVEWTHERAEAERLVVPSYPFMTPTNTRWVSERVLDSIAGSEAASTSWPSRIVISRREADRRQVLNEPEMMDVLGELGFQAIILEEMTVAEQAALFSNAEFVVAPHGAGLTNMLYAEDLTVVELFGVVRPTYYRLATMLGFEYAYALCERVGPDMVVGVDDLQTLVTRLL